jgi:Tfp pilus assembly protein PilO
MIYLFIRRTFQNVAVFDSPLFLLAITILILGFQSMLMGLMAELLARTYHESQQKLTYTVRETILKKHTDD